MPKIKKTIQAPVVTVEELNKPVVKVKKVKKTVCRTNWLGIISLAANIIIAVATTFIAVSVYVVEHNRINMDSAPAKEEVQPAN